MVVGGGGGNTLTDRLPLLGEEEGRGMGVIVSNTNVDANDACRSMTSSFTRDEILETSILARS